MRGFQGGGSERWAIYSRAVVFRLVDCEEVKIDRLAQRSRDGDR